MEGGVYRNRTNLIHFIPFLLISVPPDVLVNEVVHTFFYKNKTIDSLNEGSSKSGV